VRATAAAVTLATLAACRPPLGEPDGARPSRACPQTYEFGNSGCVEITGQVVGLRGQPLAGISVGPRYVRAGEEQGQLFSTTYASTDADGAFRFRVSRMVGRPTVVGPDTVSLWVAGADPATAGVDVPARVRDSVLVLATVSPVGAVPEPAVVRLTLPAP
jgi:hypothetical protein